MREMRRTDPKTRNLSLTRNRNRRFMKKCTCKTFLLSKKKRGSYRKRSKRVRMRILKGKRIWILRKKNSFSFYKKRSSSDKRRRLNSLWSCNKNEKSLKNKKRLPS